MKSHGCAGLQDQNERLAEELAALRRQFAALEQRVAQLELVEELWQEPGAAADQEARR